MKTSAAGIAFMKSWEKCSLEVYLDPIGKPTIGWGHLILPGENFSTLSQDEADLLFIEDHEKKAEDPVNRMVKTILKQCEFDACVSLCFNIGEGNFEHSTLLKLINSGDIEAAAPQFKRWDMSGGLVSDGLRDRREAEAIIFSQGIYTNHN